MTIDKDGLAAAARAIYEVLPNYGFERRYNTAGGSDKVRVDDPWELAPDRHEDCARQAEAAITAYLAALPEREIKTWGQWEREQQEREGK